MRENKMNRFKTAFLQVKCLKMSAFYVIHQKTPHLWPHETLQDSRKGQKKVSSGKKVSGYSADLRESHENFLLKNIAFRISVLVNI